MGVVRLVLSCSSSFVDWINFKFVLKFMSLKY